MSISGARVSGTVLRAARLGQYRRGRGEHFKRVSWSTHNRHHACRSPWNAFISFVSTCSIRFRESRVMTILGRKRCALSKTEQQFNNKENQSTTTTSESVYSRTRSSPPQPPRSTSPQCCVAFRYSSRSPCMSPPTPPVDRMPRMNAAN